MTPEFWVMTPFLKGHGDSRYLQQMRVRTFEVGFDEVRDRRPGVHGRRLTKGRELRRMSLDSPLRVQQHEKHGYPK